eukprot:m51a1_g13180 hypothetical protein (550) ;mRNA; f:80-2335
MPALAFLCLLALLSGTGGAVSSAELGFYLGGSWVSHDCAAQTSTFKYTAYASRHARRPLDYIVLEIDNPAWTNASQPSVVYDDTTGVRGIRIVFPRPLQVNDEYTFNFTLSGILSNAGAMGVRGVFGSAVVPNFAEGGPAEFYDWPKPDRLSLEATVYDFPIRYGKKNQDFERTFQHDDDAHEEGMVAGLLGPDGLPVYNDCRPQKSKCSTVISKDSFDEWFRSVPGTNKVFNRTVVLPYNNTTKLYELHDQNFFIADGMGYGNENVGVDWLNTPESCTCRKYGTPDCTCLHNFGYCMAIHTDFLYQGPETLFFSGDDDVFIFINNRLVVDLGGLPPPLQRRLALGDAALGLGMTRGSLYPFDMFYCERHTCNSNFWTATSLDLNMCEGRVCSACRGRCDQREFAVDSDNDSVVDCLDLCPNDPHKSAPLFCGCGTPEGTVVVIIAIAIIIAIVVVIALALDRLVWWSWLRVLVFGVGVAPSHVERSSSRESGHSSRSPVGRESSSRAAERSSGSELNPGTTSTKDQASGAASLLAGLLWAGALLVQLL